VGSLVEMLTQKVPVSCSIEAKITRINMCTVIWSCVYIFASNKTFLGYVFCHNTLWYNSQKYIQKLVILVFDVWLMYYIFFFHSLFVLLLLLLLLSATTYIRFWLAQPLFSNYLYYFLPIAYVYALYIFQKSSSQCVVGLPNYYYYYYYYYYYCKFILAY